MTATKKNTGLAWIIFLLSTAGLGWAIASQFEYLTLIIPIVCTSFVKALDII
ncbi:hypothetical protein [Paraflavitalea soli]|uniref:hypothetical protein n=1 Tax=Paraflavitalea soli TaxID=2315862 RepID=UPI0013C45F1E|nr:hypothetical protein [Paraflavitalea soli]